MTKDLNGDLNDLFLARRWRLWPLDGTGRTVAWDAASEYLALVENSAVEKITFESASQAKTLKELLASLRD
ncbi:MAG: hypothetical protein M3416_01560 [Acidobacteriota bacterium]|nr:hypothetical protein [Acidobacteriota bacterium]